MRLASIVILCLSQALLPSIFPRKTSFSIYACLSRFPRNSSCLSLSTFFNSLFNPAISITLSLVILAVHGSLSVLLPNQIFTANIRLFRVLSSVQASHPYSRTDQTKNLSTRSLIFMLRFILVRIFLLLLKLVVAISILFSTYVLHFPSYVTATPRFI